MSNGLKGWRIESDDKNVWVVPVFDRSAERMALAVRMFRDAFGDALQSHGKHD